MGMNIGRRICFFKWLSYFSNQKNRTSSLLARRIFKISSIIYFTEIVRIIFKLIIVDLRLIVFALNATQDRIRNDFNSRCFQIVTEGKMFSSLSKHSSKHSTIPIDISRELVVACSNVSSLCLNVDIYASNKKSNIFQFFIAICKFEIIAWLPNFKRSSRKSRTVDVLDYRTAFARR